MKYSRHHKPAVILGDQQTVFRLFWHLIIIMIIVNVGLVVVISRLIIAQPACIPKGQLEKDSRCLYIFNNKVFEIGSRNKPHKNHPCGMDVTSIIPGNHLKDAASYLDPRYVGSICSENPPPRPTPLVTPLPTPIASPPVSPSPAATATPQSIPSPTPVVLPVFPTPQPSVSPTPAATATPRPLPFATPQTTATGIGGQLPLATTDPALNSPLPSIFIADNSKSIDGTTLNKTGFGELINNTQPSLDKLVMLPNNEQSISAPNDNSPNIEKAAPPLPVTFILIAVSALTAWIIALFIIFNHK